MGVRVCNLFSGSTGNCTYLCGGDTSLLIDLGVHAPKVEKALQVLHADPDSVHVLITHRHTDHIGGLAAYLKAHPCVKVYAHYDTAPYLIAAGVKRENVCCFGDADFYVGAFTVSPVPLCHDVPCVGFCLSCGGKRVAYLADTGVLPKSALERASDCNLAVLECNHSPELVLSNAKYPPQLKKRILGSRGHLSNEACAAAAVELCRAGVQHFVLAHLSRENNYPELAYAVVQEALLREGLKAGLTLTFPDRLSELIEIG